MRKMIVVWLALMPTTGSVCRKKPSGSIDSIWLSPAPKHLTCVCTMRSPDGLWASRAAQTESSHISFISAGTPGRQITRHVVPSPRGRIEVDARRGAVAGCGRRGLPRETAPAARSAAASPASAGRTSRGSARSASSFVVQLAADGLGQRVARQIVGRRSQPAGGDDDVDALDGAAKRVGQRIEFIADRRVVEHAIADRFELLAEPLHIGVEDPAADDFVADREDFCVHDRHSIAHERFGNRPRGGVCGKFFWQLRREWVAGAWAAGRGACSLRLAMPQPPCPRTATRDVARKTCHPRGGLSSLPDRHSRAAAAEKPLQPAGLPCTPAGWRDDAQ